MISPELTIVVPTYNERENVIPLVERLDRALQSVSWEVIFVDDDSKDGTAAVVRKICLKDPRVRCLQRIGRRGLSSACIEGMLATPAPYLAVMDGDLQHDEELLPKMLTILKKNDLDVVIGSRYMEGGSIGAWEQSRIRMSRIATFLGRIILKAQLSDPMSGFFMLKRSFFEKTVHHMTGKGFKVLLDLFASAPSKVRFEELPYRFRERQAGASKLDTMAVAEYFLLLADKTIGRFIPLRCISAAFKENNHKHEGDGNQFYFKQSLYLPGQAVARLPSSHGPAHLLPSLWRGCLSQSANCHISL